MPLNLKFALVATFQMGWDPPIVSLAGRCNYPYVRMYAYIKVCGCYASVVSCRSQERRKCTPGEQFNLLSVTFTRYKHVNIQVSNYKKRNDRHFVRIINDLFYEL